MANRPLSPHLQIWKWGPHMLVSILHRITGDGMAIVGLAVLLWWLGAMAGGPETYATFQEVMGSPIGMIVLSRKIGQMPLDSTEIELLDCATSFSTSARGTSSTRTRPGRSSRPSSQSS